MNWDFIIKYLPMYERAALLTVKLGLAGDYRRTDLCNHPV